MPSDYSVRFQSAHQALEQLEKINGSIIGKDSAKRAYLKFDNETGLFSTTRLEEEASSMQEIATELHKLSQEIYKDKGSSIKESLGLKELAIRIKALTNTYQTQSSEAIDAISSRLLRFMSKLRQRGAIEDLDATPKELEVTAKQKDFLDQISQQLKEKLCEELSKGASMESDEVDFMLNSYTQEIAIFLKSFSRALDDLTNHMQKNTGLSLEEARGMLTTQFLKYYRPHYPRNRSEVSELWKFDRLQLIQKAHDTLQSNGDIAKGLRSYLDHLQRTKNSKNAI